MQQGNEAASGEEEWAGRFWFGLNLMWTGWSFTQTKNVGLPLMWTAQPFRFWVGELCGHLSNCMCTTMIIIIHVRGLDLDSITTTPPSYSSIIYIHTYIYIFTLPTSHRTCPMPYLVGNLLLVPPDHRFSKPQSLFFHAQICLGTVPRKLNVIFGIWSFVHSTGLIVGCPHFVCCLPCWNELYYQFVIRLTWFSMTNMRLWPSHFIFLVNYKTTN